MSLAIPSESLTSITATNTAALRSTLSSATAAATSYISAHGKDLNDELQSYDQAARGASASLNIMSAQQVIATATNSQVGAQATQAIYRGTLSLEALDMEKNKYKYTLEYAPNIIYFAIFSIVTANLVLMATRSRYHWYNVAYFCGYCLEFLGFLGRILSLNDPYDDNYFLLGFVCLTLGPAFIMGGIYFLFAQLVVAYGRKYSLLKPMWYSYTFITIDAVCIIVQAAGGGISSSANTEHMNDIGKNVMIAGIAFQTAAMTVFLGFWFMFIHNIFFKDRNQIETNNSYKKSTFWNGLKLLFNAKGARDYKERELERFYNIKFASVRKHKLFIYMPLALTTSVIVIYIRCVYRLVELAQGWHGYLMDHEVFLMTLDALMISISGLISIPFHPVWVFGRENILRLKNIKNNDDEFNLGDEEKQDDINYATTLNSSAASETGTMNH